MVHSFICTIWGTTLPIHAPTK